MLGGGSLVGNHALIVPYKGPVAPHAPLKGRILKPHAEPDSALTRCDTAAITSGQSARANTTKGDRMYWCIVDGKHSLDYDTTCPRFWIPTGSRGSSRPIARPN